MAVQGGADKSLAWPGRKQATVTKLRFYSTCSPPSSVHLLTHCSNFYKPLKKIQKVVCPTRSPWQYWPPRQTKNRDLSIVFSVQGTGCSPMGPDAENRVGDQDIGSPARPVSSGLQVTSEPGHCARTRPPRWPSHVAFFIPNVLQLHQQRWVILGVDSLALWKIISEVDAVLIPKNRGKNLFSRFLHSEFFWVGWVTMPPLHWLLCCLRIIVM